MVFRTILYLIVLAATAGAQPKVCTRPNRPPSPSSVTAQYKQYTINFDSSTKLFFLRDSISHKDTYIDIPYAHWPRFQDGFVVIPQGDMKALMSLDGKILLTLCHTIHTYDRLISAFRCCQGWIFLDKNGDTLNYGNGDNNYVPSLSTKTIRPAYIYQHDSTAKDSRRRLWGYLDSNARWAIQPQFDEAKEFNDSTALVRTGDRWKEITTTGATFDRQSISTPRPK